MRSLFLSTPVRASATRATCGLRLAAFGALVLAIGVATPSRAALTSEMFPGTLETVINNLDPIAATLATAVEVTASRDGTNQLTQIGFNADLFAATQIFVPVTDPGVFPIAGIVATFSNDVADFIRADGKFAGQMPLIGVNKVCLFGTCSAAVSNLSVPISVVGKGGNAFATAAVNLTVVGAPWTQGTAAIGAITRKGNAGGVTQMAAGMSTFTNDIELVTPIFVSTNIGASAIVPVFGGLNFMITSTAPEPGTIAAIGAAMVTLVGVGLARRR